MDSLTGIAAFARAAEHGSYVAAGRILGVSASAVAKSVARLEAKLGVRLLERTTRSARLTEEGALFYERCRRILDEVEDAEASLARTRETPRGKLRVSVPHFVGRVLVLPRLGEFVGRYPDIELDLNLDDRLVDIVEDGIDIAVRTGDLADTRLIARRLGPQHFVVCGTPAYFQAHGVPQHPRDLARHRCLHFRFPSSGRLQPWALRPDVAEPPLSGGLVFNNSDGILLAALGGLGIGQLPVYVARDYLADGRLQAVLTGFMAERGSLWLIWPSNRHLSPKVRVFADFVIDCLKADAGATERPG
jgi:DNA-binding transcriptional LysR family regulator